MTSRISAIDWLGHARFRPGAFVVEKDGRLDQAAEIVAIHFGVTATVRYVATGYRGELNLADIELVEEHIARDE